jgi:uncharacterized Zn finger protein
MNTTEQLPQPTPARRATVNLKSLQRQSRRLRAEQIDEEALRYLVTSASHSGAYYVVELEPSALRGSCTCPWGQHGGTNCKHILAALRARYRDSGALSFWRSQEAARRQHRPILRGDELFATLRRRSA